MISFRLADLSWVLFSQTRQVPLSDVDQDKIDEGFDESEEDTEAIGLHHASWQW